MSELSERLAALAARLDEFTRLVDVPGKQAEIIRIEALMGSPGFWDDQELARTTIDTLKGLKAIIEPHGRMSADLAGVRDLLVMAEAERDEASIADLAAEADRIRQGLDQLELNLAMSGPYDRCNVYLSVTPGAGGTDACDWAEMLVRMYTAYCNKAGYQVDMVAALPAPEAGIKFATLHIRGHMVYGHLKSKMGTHRLVRISPFNSAGTRETSFAAVEITPELDDVPVIQQEDLDPKEFRIDTYRSGGAGGQYVNKTDSAVRITHIPSGIATSCQTERSQGQNRNQAWKMMVAKLRQLQEAERLQELKDLSGERGTVGWGHQIRSYVLQPSQLVTDLRTRLKISDAQGVLDGGIQPLIDAYLRWRLKGEFAAAS